MRPAGGATGKLAAPAPEPTSNTTPPGGSTSAARRCVGVQGESRAARATATNTPGGKPHGDSGAAFKMRSGIAHAASASAQRADAVVMTPTEISLCPHQGSMQPGHGPDGGVGGDCDEKRCEPAQAAFGVEAV